MINDVLEREELQKIESIWANDKSVKKMEENWKKFYSLVEKINSPRKECFLKMLNDFEEQAVIAPASSRFEFHNAFPGGFIDHSLRVANLTIQLGKAWNVKNIQTESIIISTLFHDWGKVGTLNNPYYVHEDSEWHRQRGKIYKANSVMSNAQLGLYIFSQYEIKLTEDEYLAILLNDGPYSQDNNSYRMKEPALAVLVHFADRWATQAEKNRKSLLEPLAV